MNNAQICSIFDEIANLLEFENANPFRVRAYRNGAHVINDLAEPVDRLFGVEVLEADRITFLQGGEKKGNRRGAETEK